MKTKYRVDRLIGEGSFGQVYKGVCKMTKKKVAIKHIDQEMFLDERYSRKLVREI